MPMKVPVLMRALALISGLEAAVGLLLLLPLATKVSGPNEATLLRGTPPTSFYLMLGANGVFIVLLSLSAALLWTLNRSGLWLLVCTLSSEMLYFMVLAAFAMRDWAPGSEAAGAAASRFASAIGIGNLALGVQIVTAYPLIAGMLLYKCYRRLGIPATP